MYVSATLLRVGKSKSKYCSGQVDSQRQSESKSVMFYTLTNLKTPALLVDSEILNRNIMRANQYAIDHDLFLRPHVKTHKSTYLARRQLESGADGLAVATLAEAVVFAKAGFSSIFITRPVIETNKYETLFHLTEKADIIIAFDDIARAAHLGRYFASRNREIKLRLEIDCGQHRCGVLPEVAAAVIEELQGLPGLDFDGIFTHAGHVYAAQAAQVEEIARQEAQALVTVYREIKSKGIACRFRSLGSTPTFPYAHKYGEINEIRPGVYIFNDRMQLALHACRPEDCALQVLTTIISRPAPDRCIINAGSKVFGLDRGVHGHNLLHGYGEIVDFVGEITTLSEAHGIVKLPSQSPLAVGDNLRIIPNHACSAINLAPFFWLTRGKRVERQLLVDARAANW
jgi:D-serine deaminase-like pyridoxal phosphate-dependent protein